MLILIFFNYVNFLLQKSLWVGSESTTVVYIFKKGTQYHLR